MAVEKWWNGQGYEVILSNNIQRGGFGVNKTPLILSNKSTWGGNEIAILGRCAKHYWKTK